MRARHIGRLSRLTAAAGLLALALTSLGAGCGGDDDSEAAAGCDAARAVEAGSLQFNEACCGDAECGSGTDTCGNFNNKGQRCTKACSTDADCAGLGDGKCGGQGVCAVPG